MPHLPDMVFPNNVLILKHKNEALLEFNALYALQRVSNAKISISVESRENQGILFTKIYSTIYIFEGV